MSEIKYEDLSGDQIKWEEQKAGFTIEGQLLNFESKTTKKGKGWAIEIKTTEGIKFFFAPTLLYKQLRNAQVGDIVMIKFKGLTKSATGGNDYYEFDAKRASGTKENLEAIGLSFLQSEEDENEEKSKEIDF